MGDLYWLYIVERANHEDYSIYPIQNPANKVNLFTYDKGWKDLADKD